MSAADVVSNNPAVHVYYTLPPTKRWLGDRDTPYEIGGHPTDVEQIGIALEHRIKQIYPPNGIPDEIVSLLGELKTRLQSAEAAIEVVLVIVSNDQERRK